MSMNHTYDGLNQFVYVIKISCNSSADAVQLCSIFIQTCKKPRDNLGLVFGAWQCPTFAWANHTIIGDDSFHCPVRDGKEWDQVSIVTKQFLLLLLSDFDSSTLIIQFLHIGLTDGFCQLLFILFSSTCAIFSQVIHMLS